MSEIKKVEEFLKSCGRPAKLSEIYVAISCNNKNSLRGALNGCVKNNNGPIFRVGRGLYGLRPISEPVTPPSDAK